MTSARNVLWDRLAMSLSQRDLRDLWGFGHPCLFGSPSPIRRQWEEDQLSFVVETYPICLTKKVLRPYHAFVKFIQKCLGGRKECRVLQKLYAKQFSGFFGVTSAPCYYVKQTAVSKVVEGGFPQGFCQIFEVWKIGRYRLSCCLPVLQICFVNEQRSSCKPNRTYSDIHALGKLAAVLLQRKPPCKADGDHGQNRLCPRSPDFGFHAYLIRDPRAELWISHFYMSQSLVEMEA